MSQFIKVLLVDDESWTRDIVRTFGQWESFGMEIVGEADDGLDALELISELKPHIVITDMRMPGVDGVKLLELLNDRFPDVKAIVVSGYDDFHYAKHALRYRAVDYLLKPVDPLELNTALQKCKAELDAAAAERTPISLNIELSYSLASYKQLLRSHYNELNKDGITAVFRSLAGELDEKENTSASLLEQAAQELLLLLKELVAANSQASDDWQPPYQNASFATSSNMVNFVSSCYLDRLEQLIHQRKYKNKLNLEEVRLFMEQHYNEPVTLDQLARVFFVSKEYLSKTFKQEYNQNVTDYLLQLRMCKAKEWLADESIPIKTIAEMAGYEDVTYFYRVFKKHFGVAPGEMRKNSEV